MSNIEHTDFFPGEAFDTVRSEPDSDEEYVASHIEDDLRVAATRIRDAHDGIWDTEHERSLATLIQAGIAAERQLFTAEGDARQRLEEIVAQGEQARHDLVVANLPFAAYFARASMGRRQLPVGEPSSTPEIGRYEYAGNLKDLGTFTRIANLASPRASYEDRLQVAMEAMWSAAASYAPDHKNKAKFITYAAWSIQQAISDETLKEVGGWDVSRSTYDKYTKQIRQAKNYDAPLPTNRHLSGRGTRHDGLPHEQMLEGRRATPIDSVVFAGDTVEWDDSFDELYDETLAIEDVLASSYDDHPVDQAERNALRYAIDSVLETLSEREKGVMKTVFSLDGTDPRLLDFPNINEEKEHHLLLGSASEAYGLTIKRIQQIESKVMSKVRHPRRSDRLRDFLEENGKVSPVRTMMPIAEGTGHVKTKRSYARAASPAKHALRSEGLELWQSYTDEPFDLDEAMQSE